MLIERIQSMLPGGPLTLDFARLQTHMYGWGYAATRVQMRKLQAGSGIHPVGSGAGRLQQGFEG